MGGVVLGDVSPSVEVSGAKQLLNIKHDNPLGWLHSISTAYPAERLPIAETNADADWGRSLPALALPAEIPQFFSPLSLRYITQQHLTTNVRPSPLLKSIRFLITEPSFQTARATTDRNCPLLCIPRYFANVHALSSRIYAGAYTPSCR